MQKVLAKIDLNALVQNARLFKARGGTRLCAVVKANAYGHGGEEVTAALSGVADCFAVALIEEGLSLRTAACGKDILVLTPPTDDEEAYRLAADGLIASIPDLEAARRFVGVCRARRLVGRVHLKINTGMNRYGMEIEELDETCRLLKNSPWALVEGIYSHLYTCDKGISQEQRERFLAGVKRTREDFPDCIAHLSATYGALLGEGFSFDMVRVGLGLYGYAPVETDLPLKRVMSVWAKATATRSYEYGGAGYGERSLPKGTPLTLLRAGYADGFLRNKENGTAGCERNVNNLCMDGCIRIGRGRVGEYEPLLLDAEEIARATGTIPYEVLCAATRRAEFIYER